MTVRTFHDSHLGRAASRPPTWFSAMTLAVLRSPLHRLADRDVCGLSYLGLISGRRISLPVMYAPVGSRLVILIGDAADKQWWRSFRQPRAVRLRLRGHNRTGVGYLVPAISPEYRRLATRYEERQGVTPGPRDRLVVIDLDPA